MSVRSFAPLELIPAAAVPSSDILMAGITQPPEPRGRGSSDLFPEDSYRDLQGILGDYRGGDPREGHPLYEAMQGLYAAYYDFGNQERENGFERTEMTRRGMISTMLQKRIAGCIAQGYDNIAKLLAPGMAIRAITGHIEAQDEVRTAEYNSELDHHASVLAKLDRGDEEPTPTEINGIPVISAREIDLWLGRVPESPEVERERRKEYAEQQIGIVRKRLIRLRFEYMSATALTQLLREAVAPPVATEPEDIRSAGIRSPE